MAIKLNLENTHAYCFPTKVLAGNGGEHILNIELTADADNGSIVTAGDYKSFDNYVEGTAPAAYEAKIVDVAANGNFYVQVVEPADAVLICEVIDNYNASAYYEPSYVIVRAYNNGGF